jgi:hypothetical protein
MARELEKIYGDALAEIGATGPDRVVSAEDGEEMARIYNGVWHMLESMGLTSWDLDGPVPNDAAIPLVWILAFHAAQPFGITGERLERLRATGQLAGPQVSLGERLLRKLAAPEYLNETVQVVDY